MVVLMSTYNGEKYIKTQIDSIISQVDVSVELVIRDDGSSDATKSIVQDYGDSCVLICGNNVGCAKSFFELLRYANTNYSDDYYFAFADQDDYWMPEKLATAVRQLDAFGKSTPNLYFSNLCVVDGDLKNGKLLYNESVNLDKPHSLIQNYASGCTMVFNKKAVEKFMNTVESETLPEQKDFDVEEAKREKKYNIGTIALAIMVVVIALIYVISLITNQ